MDTLLAVRLCGCAVAMVAADSSEVPNARAYWTRQGWEWVRLAQAPAIARLLADGARHAAGQCSAAPPVQLALFSEAA